MLILFTSMQVMLIIEQTGQYLRAIEGLWYKNFLFHDDEYNEDFERTRNFFRYSEVRDALNFSIANYHNILHDANDSFDIFEQV